METTVAWAVITVIYIVLIMYKHRRDKAKLNLKIKSLEERMEAIRKESIEPPKTQWIDDGACVREEPIIDNKWIKIKQAILNIEIKERAEINKLTKPDLASTLLDGSFGDNPLDFNPDDVKDGDDK